MSNWPWFAITLVLSFVAGVIVERERTNVAVNNAVADARAFEAARTEGVVNDWARNVDSLRTRIRNGDVPKIPVPAPSAAPLGSGLAPWPPASGVPAAGELETCRAERQQLIDDGARTMINYDALRKWAR